MGGAVDEPRSRTPPPAVTPGREQAKETSFYMSRACMFRGRSGGMFLTRPCVRRIILFGEKREQP